IGRRGGPWRADLVAAAVVAALVLLLRRPDAAVGLSAFCVLLYYALANASAMRLGPHERRSPRWTAYLGLAGCLALAGTLPRAAVLTGTAVLVITLSLRAIITARRAR